MRGGAFIPIAPLFSRGRPRPRKEDTPQRLDGFIRTETVITRDQSGNATAVTQANGALTDYGYDALDRLTHRRRRRDQLRVRQPRPPAERLGHGPCDDRLRLRRAVAAHVDDRRHRGDDRTHTTACRALSRSPSPTARSATATTWTPTAPRSATPASAATPRA